MDLILFAPGDPAFFENLPRTPAGGLPDAMAKDLSGVDLKACIELVSLQHGVKQQVTTDVSASARTSGRPLIAELTCVKYVDAHSVRLHDYCLRARPLGAGVAQPTVVYVLRNSGDRMVNVLQLSLRDAIVSEVQFQTHPDDMPTEQFKLNFTEIIWASTVQTSEGRPSGVVSAGWSVARNRPIGVFTDSAPR